jgi:hypothetical protein
LKEYRIVDFRLGTPRADVEKTINDAAQEGWRVIHIVSSDRSRVWLERDQQPYPSAVPAADRNENDPSDPNAAVDEARTEAPTSELPEDPPPAEAIAAENE